MPRDSEGRDFFGFCGQRAYLPEEEPKAESLAEYVLRLQRHRLLAEMLSKDEPAADSKPANGSVEPHQTAAERIGK